MDVETMIMLMILIKIDYKNINLKTEIERHSVSDLTGNCSKIVAVPKMATLRFVKLIIKKRITKVRKEYQSFYISAL